MSDWVKTLKIFTIVVVLVLSTVIVYGKTDVTPITYKSYIDGTFGFYKIRTTVNKPITYENHTLTINQGDTIIWISDTESKQFTIISDQRLWNDNSAFLKSFNDVFSYTFVTPGTYSFHVKDISAMKQNIIVDSVDNYQIDTPVPTVNYQTPIPTATYSINSKTPVPTANYGNNYRSLTQNVTYNTPTAMSTAATPTSGIYMPIPTPIINIPDIGISKLQDVKLPIEVTRITILSVIVGIICILTTYKYGKN